MVEVSPSDSLEQAFRQHWVEGDPVASPCERSLGWLSGRTGTIREVGEEEFYVELAVDSGGLVCRSPVRLGPEDHRTGEFSTEETLVYLNII